MNWSGLLLIVLLVCGSAYWLITTEQEQSIANRTTVCIDGVKYYMIREYQKGFMAPAYDPGTLQVKTCTTESR